MTMTREEARRFIEEAERLPPGEVDQEKLKEAIEAISGAVDITFEDVVSAAASTNVAYWTVRGWLTVLEKIEPEAVRRFFAGDDEDLERSARATGPFSAVPFRQAREELLERGLSLLAESRSTFTPDGGPVAAHPRGGRGRVGATLATRLPEGLLGRYYQAAERAGVDPEEAQRHLVQLTSGSGPVTITNPLTGQPESIPVEETVDPTAAIEGQIIDWLSGAIGVPPGFFALRQETTSTHPTTDLVNGRPVPMTRQDTAVAPRYFDGDEYSPAGMSPEEIARVQTRLEAAGLLEPGGYWSGTWDSLTSAAYKSALGIANQTGHTIDRTVDQLIATLPDSIREQRRRIKAAETFQAPPYMKPDKTALAQRVKDEIRAALGRDPTPDDLAWGISGLGDDYRRQYEQQVAAARRQFNAEEGRVPGGGVFEAVDPMSRFRERLEQRFGPEIDYRESLPDVRQNIENVFASLTTMGSLIGP